MNEQERREAIWRLYNPQLPDPFVSHDYGGVLMRDIPPRRTLREKIAAVGWYRRYLRAQRRAEREAAARTHD
jgi:hypothetical protein